ncbi:MAG TPA: RNA pyrophosphohydrolase [Stellaceae bacterium]|nr:RNA pyrophosphohydrolase [Stellaceae bacterium]
MSESTPEAGAASGYRRAVGIMLLNAASEVFVAQRIDFAQDAWQMPQGGIDEGEAPRAAAFRELKEEIGTDQAEIVAESGRWLTYDYPPELRGRAWRGRYRGQIQKWFAMRFTGSDADIDLETAHPEFRAWKWIPPQDLPRLIVAFKRQLYLDVLMEFRELLKL